jgi:hypothetical protein
VGAIKEVDVICQEDGSLTNPISSVLFCSQKNKLMARRGPLKNVLSVIFRSIQIVRALIQKFFV